MQVLHTTWRDAREPGEQTGLFVWAETNDAPRPKRGRRKPGARFHPFLVHAADLTAMVRKVIALGDREAKIDRLDMWLPTSEYGPIPSPDLPHEWSEGEASPELRQWKMRGLWLEPNKAFELFMALANGAGPGTRLGSDTRYWLQAMNFVLEILAQQKFRPAMIELHAGREAEYAARWLPVLDSEQDVRRLVELAAAMPPAARAGAPSLEQTVPPQVMLESFLEYMVDMGATRWLVKGRPNISNGDRPEINWLQALFFPHYKIDGTASQLRHLYDSYRAWTRILTVAGDRTMRVAFRLEAPQAHGSEWRLHYLLQARDDASLIIPANEVWDSKSSVLDALGRRFERPQERLLAGLGYAGRFFDPIRQSLEHQAPAGISLSSDQAFVFLRDCAPTLERSGFAVLTPPWWNKPGTRLGVRLRLGSSSQLTSDAAVSSGRLSLDKLVDYRWDLSIGDTSLTHEEFNALVALKSPLVMIRGQWVQLDPDQIESAIRFWEEQESLAGKMSLLEAMQLGLGGEIEHDGLPVEGVDMDAWLSEWLDRLRGDEKLETLPPPADLHATLRPYQLYGYSWLRFACRWGMGVILADDMGLGKTIQTLALVQRLSDEARTPMNGGLPALDERAENPSNGGLTAGGLPAPVLLICPTSVVTNWQLESERFTPGLKTMIHQGADRLHGDEFDAAARHADMVLTSYALARRDAADLRRIDWLGIALDEAQNIKNANTKQARVIRSLSSDFRLALTGTPVENRLSELWSIMRFLNPGFLGGPKEFRERFVLPIEKYGDEEAVDKLRGLTRPFILRRVKTDPAVITDLPEKQEVKVYCHLSEEQATLYEAVVQDALQGISAQGDDNIARKGMVLSMLMQLKQVCNHPAQYLHQVEAYNALEDNGRSGKLQRFHALLEEVLAEGDRMLVFTQFTEMGDLLRASIEERYGAPTLYLHGSVGAKKRAEMVRRFQSDDGPPVFILSLKAGGTGLNLTNANHVFHFDRWWNPAVEDQATDRAFRIGQQRNVLVHKFVCLGTLEERIDEMIEDKRALAESVVGGAGAWLTEMSTASLRELVRLRLD